MNENVTLLTMMTGAARCKRRDQLPDELVPPSGVDMKDVLRDTEEGSSPECADGGALSSKAGVPCPGLPTRLADGRGLESALVRIRGPKPLSRPVPARWFPRSGARWRGIRLHDDLFSPSQRDLARSR